MKRITLVIIILLSIVSCRKDLAVDIEDHLYYHIENIGIIKKNDIYYYEYLDRGSIQITNTPDSIKTDLRMSYDHQKFAYKNEDGIIEIVDRSGNSIEKLIDYTNVKSFDWSADSQTLWMLNNNTIEFYGPEMDIPELTFPDVSNGNYPMINIDMLSISSTGDLAYVAFFEWYPNQSGPEMENSEYAFSFIRKLNNGTNEIVDLSTHYHHHNYNELRYAPFSQDLVVSLYGNSGTKSIRLYKGNNLDYEHEFIIQGGASNPLYRPDLNFFIYSQPVEYALLHPRFHIQDLATGQIETYNSIISYNSNLSIDWK